MAKARGYDARACQNRQPVLFHRHPGQGGGGGGRGEKKTHFMLSTHFIIFPIFFIKFVKNIYLMFS